MRSKIAWACCVSLVAISSNAVARQTGGQGAAASGNPATPVEAAANGGPQTPADTPATDTTAADTTAADIVVTASKSTAQTVVQAPLTIQAFSGAELAAKNIRSIDSLITAVPGASQSEQLGEFIRTYSIRGSGTGGGIGDSLIGYYIDDTAYVIPNAQLAPPLRLFDIDRVEVLRGPYGTLYGAGSMGGTIIFHTKDPDLRKATGDGEAYVSSTKGAGDPNYGAAGAISIPIVDDRLALRVSGGYDSRAGYADVYSAAPVGTPAERDANGGHHQDIRASLLYKPDDRFTARLQFLYFGGKQDYSQQLSSVSPAYLAYTGGIKGNERADNKQYSGTLSYDLGFATVTSATGYLTFDTSYLTGTVNPVLGAGSLYNQYKGNSFTQEVRLASNASGPLHWVLGGFYNDAKSNYNFDLNFVVPVFNGTGTTATRTKNYAGFGEVSYDFLDGKLVPLGGIRVYHDDRSFTSGGQSAFALPGSGSSSPTVTTWRANLSYHPSTRATVYLNAGTGFRSGIVQSVIQRQALAADGIQENQALNPDRMRNLELGAKARFRPAGLTAEVNLYDLRYTDIQYGLVTSVGIPGFASLGSAKIQGIDFALSVMPVEGLTFGVSGDVNRSRYTDVNPAVAAGVNPRIVRVGGKILNQPAYTLRFDGGYSRPIGEDLTVYGNASASLGDRRIGNQAGDLTARTTIVDANIGLRTGRYEFEAFGANLTDERGPWYIRQNNPPLVAGPVPRTIGLRVRLHYK